MELFPFVINMLVVFSANLHLVIVRMTKQVLVGFYGFRPLFKIDRDGKMKLVLTSQRFAVQKYPQPRAAFSSNIFFLAERALRCDARRCRVIGSRFFFAPINNLT
ncbi:MAG: hypothetical protein AAFY09_14010 [Pseudomonadota bacterium]